MKNNEINVRVTEDQFYILKILNELDLFEIIKSWTTGMAYYVTVKRKDDQLNKENNLIDEFIMMLDKFKKQNPDQVIIMETSSGTVECRIGDANIYDDPYGKIIIDAE